MIFFASILLRYIYNKIVIVILKIYIILFNVLCCFVIDLGVQSCIIERVSRRAEDNRSFARFTWNRAVSIIISAIVIRVGVRADGKDERRGRGKDTNSVHYYYA